MTGHLHPPLMRLLDRRAELGARNVHVRLERRRAGIGPEIHHAPSVVSSRELVHLIQAESGTFEIGRGRVEPGTRLLSGIDVVLDSEVTKAVQVAAGAHRCHAPREIESREALRHVRVDAGAGGVEKVLVHHHQSRDHRFSRKVDDLRAARYGDRPRVAECGNATIADDEGLIISRRHTGPINHAGVRECDDGRVDGDERVDSSGKCGALGVQLR